jgi:hypothetical protein
VSLPGGFDKAIDEGLTSVGIAVKRLIGGRNFFLELARKTFWRSVFGNPPEDGGGPAGEAN